MSCYIEFQNFIKVWRAFKARIYNYGHVYVYVYIYVYKND